MAVAMETGQAGAITTHSNLSTGGPQLWSPGPTLTSRNGFSPFMKAHPLEAGQQDSWVLSHP